MKKMRAIQVVKPDELRVIEMDEPEVTKPDEVKVKMTAAGICGSDVGIYHGTNAAATYPRVIGHEMVGIVTEAGPEVKKVKVGDRVIIDQVTACGHCYACRKGRPNVCGNLKVRGVHIDGGYREYMVVPESDCCLVPENLSDVDAVMIEPTTIAVQCCSRAELEKEDMVLILGAGALGVSVLKLVKTFEPEKIIVADIDDQKLKEALELGADAVINTKKEDLTEACRRLTDGYGATVSIDAACFRGSVLQAMNATGNAGRVITMGFSIAPDEFNQFVVTSRELDIRGSRLQNRKFQQAIDLIESGKINIHGSASHTFPVWEAQKAFDFVDSRDPSIRKVVLTF